MIEECLDESYMKTAKNYFLVDTFLARPESRMLGILARFALILMMEPNPYVTAGQLAERMAVSEADAKAALGELLATGHVYRTSYLKDS